MVSRLILVVALVLLAAPAAAGPVVPIVATALVAAGVSATAATVLATVIVYAGVALASTLLSSALGRGKAPRGREQDIVRELGRANSLPPYRFVYGTARVAGSPAPIAVKGNVLWACLILNSRPSDQLTAVEIDKRVLEWTGDIHDMTDGAEATNAPFAGYVRLWCGLGDQTAPPPLAVSEAPEIFSATDGWQGRTVLWLRMDAGPSADRLTRWPTVPPFVEVTLRGCKVWNPNDPAQDADDPDTWTWDDNRALCLLDALRQNPVRPYPLSQINVLSFSAASLSDREIIATAAGTEARYRANGVLVWSDTELEQQLTPLVEAGASRLVRVGGKLALTEGVWVGPVATITDILDDDLVYETLKPGRDLATTVLGTYVEPSADWQMTALQAYAVPGAQAADGGIEVVREESYSFVTSATQAQRLQKIAALRNRAQRRIACTLPPEYIRLVAGNVVTVALPAPWGALNGTYEVVSIAPRLIEEDDAGVAARCAVELLETSAAVYAWDVSEEQELVTAPGYGLPSPQPLPAPEGLALTASSAFTGQDEIPAIQWRVDAPTDSRAEWIEVEYREIGGNWLAGPIQTYDREEADVWLRGLLVPVTVGVTYDVRLRWASAGRASEWVEGTLTMTAPSIILESPTGLTATPGVNAVEVSATVPNDPNARGIEIWGSYTSNVLDAVRVFGPIYLGANSTFTATQVVPGDLPRWYWARTVGPYDVPSAFTASVTATPTLTAQADFRGGTVPAGVTFTRASVGNSFNSSGDLVESAVDVARFDHDALLAALGLLIEPTRTNDIDNPRGEFAAVPSFPQATQPTNWSSAGAGVTVTVEGAGTVAGLPYVDIRYQAASAPASIDQRFSLVVGASSGTYTGSVFVATVGGSLANISSAALLFVGQAGTTVTATLDGTLRRATHTAALTAQRRLAARLNCTAGAAVDVTVRYAAPQYEAGAFATTPILPAIGVPAATTRSADSALLAVANGSYDVLTQDAAGGAFALAQTVSGGSLALAPRTDLRHVRRTRLWPAGLLTADQRTALSVAA